MNRFTTFAIILSLLTFGALQETFRILTSQDKDIAENRSGLIPMAVVITAALGFFAIRFWLKSMRSPNR